MFHIIDTHTILIYLLDLNTIFCKLFLNYLEINTFDNKKVKIKALTRNKFCIVENWSEQRHTSGTV